MLAALQGSPMANPESLKDKAGGKCLICRQAGHWANLVTSLLKWLATNAIKLGHWEALCPQVLVKCQDFPHNDSTGLKWPTPACPPVTDNHHRARAKGATGFGK